MDLVPGAPQKLYGNGRYDAFPAAAACEQTVLGLWRSGKDHVGDAFDLIMGKISQDGGRTYGEAFTPALDGKPMLSAGATDVAWDPAGKQWVMLQLYREPRATPTGTVTALLARVLLSKDALAWERYPGGEVDVTTVAWFFASGLYVDESRWVVAGYGELRGESGWVPLTSTSTDGGKTWTPLAAPVGTPRGDLSEPQVVRTRTGEWLLVARDDTTLTHHQFRSVDGVEWTYDKPILGSVSGLPRMTVTRDNIIVMLIRLMPGADPYHAPWAWAWSADDGATWSLRTDFPDQTRWMMYGGLAATPDGGLACVYASEDDPEKLWQSCSVYACRFDSAVLEVEMSRLVVAPRVAVPYVVIRGAGRKKVTRTTYDPWLARDVQEDVRYPSEREAGTWWDFELQQGCRATYTTGDRTTRTVKAPELPGPLIIHPTRPELSLRVEIVSDGGDRDYPFDVTVESIPAAAGALERPQTASVGTSGMLGAASGSTVVRTLTLNEARRLRQCFTSLTPVFFSAHRESDFPAWFQITKLASRRYVDFDTSRYASWDDDTDETQWRDWTIQWVEQDRPTPAELSPHRRIRDVDRRIEDINVEIGAM